MYQRPTSAAPANDTTLENVFQDVIVGIVGINPQLVRPRFQAIVPNQPGFDEDWVAFGITPIAQDTFAHVKHSGSVVIDEPTSSEVSRDETMEAFLSFYGPNCNELMQQWREGLAIEENRYQLLQQGIKVVALGDPIYLPALLKERWVRRVDLKLTLSRRVTRTYAVPTIAVADVDLDNEKYVTNITVINQ